MNNYKKQFVVVNYQQKQERVLAFQSQTEFKSKENLIRGILEDYLTSDNIDMRSLLNVAVEAEANTPYRIINSNFTVRGGRAINGEKSPMRVAPRFMLEVSASMKMELRTLAAECKTSMARIINVIINDYCKNIKVPNSFEASKTPAMTKVLVRLPQKDIQKLKFHARIHNRTLAQEIAFKLSESINYFKTDPDSFAQELKASSKHKNVKLGAKYIRIPTVLDTAFKNMLNTFNCTKTSLLHAIAAS